MGNKLSALKHSLNIDDKCPVGVNLYEDVSVRLVVPRSSTHKVGKNYNWLEPNEACLHICVNLCILLIFSSS